MPKPKKPTPLFEVLFVGSGVYPEKIPLGILTDTFAAVRRLAAGAETQEEECDEEEGQEDSVVRLLSVKRGSAVFAFVAQAAPSTLARLRGAGKVVDEPDEFGDNDYVLKPIELLSATAKRLNCSVVVREAGNKAVLATIGPTSYQRIAEHLFLTGETAFTGRVERVGGATVRTCALRVPFQSRMLYCRVATEEVARRLGERLYQEVAVQGTATWLRNSWRVVGFTVNSIYQPQAGSLSEAFQALRDAGGKGWDGIDDPRGYLEEVTGK
jgi:hypothetical protein